MVWGLPLDAWLLVLGSIVPGIVITALYTRKAKQIEALREKGGL